MPGAGHLVHMPAHLYIRLGSTMKPPSETSMRPTWIKPIWPSAHQAGIMPTSIIRTTCISLGLAHDGGASAEATRVARELTNTITEEEARTDKWKEVYLPTPLYSLIRFGRWDELLREPPPPKDFRLMDGMWRLGRGLALASTGRLPGADGEHYALADLTKQIKRDRSQEEKISRILLKIAERMLAGEIAARRQQYDDAIRTLKEAVKLKE